MANPSKVKGTRYETALVDVFNDWNGIKCCERVVLHGDKDHGDIRLSVDDLTICVEAKWNKSYPNEKDARLPRADRQGDRELGR